MMQLKFYALYLLALIIDLELFCVDINTRPQK